MKPRTVLAISLCMAAPAISPAADSVAAADSLPAAAAQITFHDAASPEVADIRVLGDRAIKRLAYSLVSEAWSTVSNDGAAKALAVCHLKNVPASGAVIPDMPRITAFKRTSLKLRDPQNTPDEADQRALDRVNRILNSGQLPPDLLVQRIERPDAAGEWRVYRPVAVMKQCLACHGPIDQQPAELRAELQARFPNDHAADYNLGDWRGLLRVSVSDAAPIAQSPARPTALKK